MHALILKHDAALGEGTRKAGDVLGYLPDGVDFRELATAVLNDLLRQVAETPAPPVSVATPAAEAGAEAAPEPKKTRKPKPA
ncbi:MAG: hypothetical protein IPM64_18035 [Phycisphaerales bacterium]|nr:hypothetical protein [Phycisphaerales bacterium]